MDMELLEEQWIEKFFNFLIKEKYFKVNIVESKVFLCDFISFKIFNRVNFKVFFYFRDKNF